MGQQASPRQRLLTGARPASAGGAGCPDRLRRPDRHLQAASGVALASILRSHGELAAICDIGALTVSALGRALAQIVMMPTWAQGIAPISPGYWAVTMLKAAVAGEPDTVTQAALILTAVGIVAGAGLCPHQLRSEGAPGINNIAPHGPTPITFHPRPSSWPRACASTVRRTEGGHPFSVNPVPPRPQPSAVGRVDRTTLILQQHEHSNHGEDPARSFDQKSFWGFLSVFLEVNEISVERW